MKNTVYFESLLEQDYIFLLETNPNVLSYSSQPITINYLLYEKERSYTPDFLVTTKNGIDIVEVKIKSKIPKYDELFSSVIPIFKSKDWNFKVMTEEFIREQPRLNNAKLLYRYSNSSITPDQYAECLSIMRNHEFISISDLQSLLSQKGIPSYVPFYLLFRGEFDYDESQIISRDTQIYI